MPNGTYGGVRGRKTKVGRKLLRFPPTRFMLTLLVDAYIGTPEVVNCRLGLKFEDDRG